MRWNGFEETHRLFWAKCTRTKLRAWHVTKAHRAVCCYHFWFQGNCEIFSAQKEFFSLWMRILHNTWISTGIFCYFEISLLSSPSERKWEKARNGSALACRSCGDTGVASIHQVRSFTYLCCRRCRSEVVAWVTSSFKAALPGKQGYWLVLLLCCSLQRERWAHNLWMVTVQQIGQTRVRWNTLSSKNRFIHWHLYSKIVSFKFTLSSQNSFIQGDFQFHPKIERARRVRTQKGRNHKGGMGSSPIFCSFFLGESSRGTVATSPGILPKRANAQIWVVHGRDPWPQFHEMTSREKKKATNGAGEGKRATFAAVCGREVGGSRGVRRRRGEGSERREVRGWRGEAPGRWCPGKGFGRGRSNLQGFFGVKLFLDEFLDESVLSMKPFWDITVFGWKCSCNVDESVRKQDSKLPTASCKQGRWVRSALWRWCPWRVNQRAKHVMRARWWIFAERMHTKNTPMWPVKTWNTWATRARKNCVR